MSPPDDTDSKKITPDDIKAKFGELQGSTDERVESAQSMIAVAAVAAVGTLVVVAFALGRRRGKKRQTVVEIRRI
ncbi:MAG: hypothetical protein R3A49_02710 [Acidimicrobiia bacterium]